MFQAELMLVDIAIDITMTQTTRSRHENMTTSKIGPPVIVMRLATDFWVA